MTKPTEKAAEFMAANDASPVVEGAVTFKGGEHPKNATGARYTLESGRNYVLTSADLRSMPKKYPKWKLV